MKPLDAFPTHAGIKPKVAVGIGSMPGLPVPRPRGKLPPRLPIDLFFPWIDFAD